MTAFVVPGDAAHILPVLRVEALSMMLNPVTIAFGSM